MKHWQFGLLNTSIWGAAMEVSDRWFPLLMTVAWLVYSLRAYKVEAPR